MNEHADHKIPDPASVRRQILSQRSAFGSYNVVRLGELIRRLPEDRRKPLETVPLLLHMNTPGLPGYVNHPQTPHGIYRFSESGFWKIGRRRLGMAEETIQSFILKRYSVRGIYLVGSSGTHGQTEVSDLNYWVLIDRQAFDDRQRELFAEKLGAIREWSWKRHGQALTFLVLDLDQMRRNDFAGWADPCIALPQGSLMKEEFYRTFMLIAGQIPFWAVLPAGLSDADYARWIEAARQPSDTDFLAEDYVDLGNLNSIDREECPGALLSEICRVRQDPVRSLIKASLLAHHFFHQEEQGPLCEGIKQAFSKPRSQGEFPDPAVYAFEQAVRFYEKIDDPFGLDLIRQCIYLRLLGYPAVRPPKEGDPKEDLLHRIRRQWSWSTEQGDRIESYVEDPEEQKLGLEDRILQRLRFLFNLVVREKGRPKPTEGTGAMDIETLRNRLEVRFAKESGTIPYASALLRARRDLFSLHVALQKDPAGGDRWAVYDRPHQGARLDASSFFSDSRLLRVLGWIILNGLYEPERSSVMFHRVPSAIVARRAEEFLKDLHRFFRREASAEDLRIETAWVKLLVVLDHGLGPAQRGLTFVDFLIQNTWGGLFLFSLDLARVENNLLRCYEIAQRVWQLMGEASKEGFEYRIVHSRTIEDVQAKKHIEDFIGSFRDEYPGDPVS